MSGERKCRRNGSILFDPAALLIKAKLYKSTSNLSWNKTGNCFESLAFRCDGGAKRSCHLQYSVEIIYVAKISVKLSA